MTVYAGDIFPFVRNFFPFLEMTLMTRQRLNRTLAGNIYIMIQSRSTNLQHKEKSTAILNC